MYINQCTLMDIYKGEPSTEFIANNFMAGAGLFIAKRSQSYLSMNYDAQLVTASKDFNLSSLYDDVW